MPGKKQSTNRMSKADNIIHQNLTSIPLTNANTIPLQNHQSQHFITLSQSPMPSPSSSTSTDTCTSRHFSWLMKSCFPNPQNPHIPSPLSTLNTTNIASLPDEILLECLIRVPYTTLPLLLSVCRRWAHILNSPSFVLLRHRHRLITRTLYTIAISNSTLFTATLNTNEDCSWKVSSFVLAGNEFSGFLHSKFVVIGRKIYVIGRDSMLRWDTWTGTLVPKAGMSLRRKKFAVAEVAGRIYVAGGSGKSSVVEEYDPDENVWRVASHAPRRRYGCIGAAVDGVFCVIGGLKVGGNEVSRAARAEEAYASSLDMYDVVARVWLRSRTVPIGGCVVAACATDDGYIYVLSSHAVELSFWKFGASRKRGDFGAWVRIKSPPLPPQVGLDNAVRFSCVGVGDAVVLVQVVGCLDDLWRRSLRTERCGKDRLVLIYGCGDGEWRKGPDLPEVIRRAASVCVEY